MSFARLPLDALRALLAEASWQELFVEIAHCDPIVGPLSEVTTAFLREVGPAHGLHEVPIVDPAMLTVIDRPTAARYIAVLLQFELAYGELRLDGAPAQRAAALFLEPFGPDATFYSTVVLTEEVLRAKERQHPGSYAMHRGILGSTLEEGVLAIDRAGCLGALFVGDED